MTDQGVQPNPISGQVLFYTNPEPLDATRHKDLGMKRSDRPFGFCAEQHFVPLHVSEFGPASVNYPIIFAGTAKAPLAIMGLATGENLFISDDGMWRPGAYIPSFVRRYPFVGAADGEAKRVIVCIDRDAPQWVGPDEADVMLFENGEPSEFTKSCIDFCSRFDADRQATDFFVNLLIEHDLFEPREATYTPYNPDGTPADPKLVSDFFAVSDEKMKQLSPEKLAEFRDNGALPQIYAHQASLFGWDKIIGESLFRRAATAPANQA